MLPNTMMYDDYEERYAEALDLVRLKLKDKTIGVPERSNGIRFINVDGMLCSDEMILRMAWGEAAARDIMSRKPKS
jgi:hypothetical protein